jgi:hypothetical protein
LSSFATCSGRHEESEKLKLATSLCRHHLRRVQFGVRRLARKDFKIVWMVVALVLVFMVDDLARQKSATKLCLSDDPVNVATADPLVTLPVVAIGKVAVTGAELMDSISDVLLSESPVEGLPAMMAIQLRAVALCCSDASLGAVNRFRFLELAVIAQDSNAANPAWMFFFHTG